MFRLSQFLEALDEPAPTEPRRASPGPVVIWNLVRRCNLTCLHCYSGSSDKSFPGELATDEILRVMGDLKAFCVPVLILSGGEPLLRPDIYDIARHAKQMGFYVALSTNGTLINQPAAQRIAALGLDYVGISLDGVGETHDKFRGKTGAFSQALQGIRLCRETGVKVGLRFTMTEENFPSLPRLLEVMEEERVEKFYLSHLNYAGRGNANRDEDAALATTRQAMELLFEAALAHVEAGRHREFVTGNNDADGPFLLQWVAKRFPEKAAALEQRLIRWGGNASGINVANIDNRGDVHPDTMWWNHTIGNVRQRAFGDIWNDLADPLMAGLKQRPRPVSGRCAACRHLPICNGNTRTRAFRLTGDPWTEDPGCYLTDEEIGLKKAAE
ncbi:MAG: heme d1 biosynthesis radical SAM protein NirJ [Rhodospirillales bacterium]|nr:heme d1 biosynthesis radical SAM protein NirJ [Rhodospirillales bacterium]